MQWRLDTLSPVRARWAGPLSGTSPSQWRRAERGGQGSSRQGSAARVAPSLSSPSPSCDPGAAYEPIACSSRQSCEG